MQIVEFLYEPEEVTISKGATITFTNRDKAVHTATADGSSFDTGGLGKGDAADVTFDEPGTYTYFCRFHAFMKGSIVVK